MSEYRLSYTGKELDEKLKQVDENKNQISTLENKINQSSASTKKSDYRTLGKAAIWYYDYTAWGESIEECARNIAKFDLIVGGGALHVEGQTSEEQIKIIKRARELNPEIKFFFYFSIASWRNDNGFQHILKPGGIWDKSEADGKDGYVRIHNKWEHYQFIERALHMGGYPTDERELVEKDYTWTDENGVVHTEDKYINLWAGGVAFDGVFYDDAGMDSNQGVINQGYKNLRDKSICLCDFTHRRGLSAFINQLNADLWYSSQVSSANPDGLPSAIDSREFLLVESCHTQHGDSSGYPLWRHADNSKAVYDYYKNYYPTVGAKVVVNDYRVSALSKDECDKLRTFCIFDCIATGAHYLDFNGDLTWELPESVELFSITKDEQYNNIYVEDGTYTLKANNHTLTVKRPSSILAGATCDENTLDRIEITIDGETFNNAYANAPALDKKIDTRLVSVENTLEEMQTSEKKTASVYHRMLIDDWGKEYIYTNLVSDKWWEQLLSDIKKYMTVESSDVGTKSINAARVDDTQVTKDLIIDVSNKRGHVVEFGMDIVNNTPWACGVNILDWYPANENNEIESTLYPEQEFYVQRVEIPEGYENDTLTLRLVFNGDIGAVFNFTNFYVIDKDQFNEDVVKNWYTNIVPNVKKHTTFNYETDYTFKQNDTYSFELTYDNPDSYHSWAGIMFTFPDGTFKQGHQYEIGCEKFETNLGEYNTDIAFRLNVWASPDGYEFWFPKTEKMISKVYDEERNAKLITLSSDRVVSTGGGRLSLTNIASSNKNSNTEYAKAVIENLYIYDLDEDNIVFRGDDPSNSFLQICRVTDEKLAQDKKLIGDALYITDSGLVFMTDFNGNRVKLKFE